MVIVRERGAGLYEIQSRRLFCKRNFVSKTSSFALQVPNTVFPTLMVLSVRMVMPVLSEYFLPISVKSIDHTVFNAADMFVTPMANPTATSNVLSKFLFIKIKLLVIE